MSQIADQRARLHELVDSLGDEQLEAAGATLEQLRQEQLLAHLATIPGVRVPAVWPAKFAKFDPMPYEGEEPPSQEIIRLRR